MEVTKYITFDAAHRLPSHCGRCSCIHGHTFKLEVSVSSDDLFENGSSEGMILDYKDLKQTLMEQVDSVFDHSLNLYYGDPYCKSICDMYGITYDEDTFKEYDLGMLVWTFESYRFNILNFIPTSENLACYIFTKLYFTLDNKVSKVVLYETPTSKASFTLEDFYKINRAV